MPKSQTDRVKSYLIGVVLGLRENPVTTVMQSRESRAGVKIGQAIARDVLTGNAPGLTVSDLLERGLRDLKLNGPPSGRCAACKGDSWTHEALCPLTRHMLKGVGLKTPKPRRTSTKPRKTR